MFDLVKAVAGASRPELVFAVYNETPKMVSAAGANDALNPANYVVTDNIGAPAYSVTKAERISDYVVKLTVNPDQVFGRTYTLAVNNVQSLAGVTITGNPQTITALGVLSGETIGAHVIAVVAAYLVEDTFQNKAVNSDINGAVTTTGAKTWTVTNGTCAVKTENGTGVGTEHGLDFLTHGAGSARALFPAGVSNNFYVEFKQYGPGMSMFYRGEASNIGYFIDWFSTGVNVYRANDAGFDTDLIYTTTVVGSRWTAASDVFKVEIAAGLQTFYKNGVQFGSVIDGSYIGDLTGVYGTSSDSQPVFITNIGVQNLTPVPSVAEDTFTRADNAGSQGVSGAGSTEIGGMTYTIDSPTGAPWGISGNKLYKSGIGVDSNLHLDPDWRNVEFSVRIDTLGADHNWGLVFRANNGQNFYLFGPALSSGNNVHLYKRVGGGFTQLGTTQTRTMAAGDVFKIRCVGTSLKCYVNDVLYFDVVDTTWQVYTKIGFYTGGGQSDHRWDNLLVVQAT